MRVLLKPCDRGLTLALLVARIALADNHYAAVAADHLAVIANWLDAGVDLHVISFFAVLVLANCREPLLPEERRRVSTYIGRRCDHGSDRTE